VQRTSLWHLLAGLACRNFWLAWQAVLFVFGLHDKLSERSSWAQWKAGSNGRAWLGRPGFLMKVIGHGSGLTQAHKGKNLTAA
jgi:hypothetical protein